MCEIKIVGTTGNTIINIRIKPLWIVKLLYAIPRTSPETKLAVFSSKLLGCSCVEDATRRGNCSYTCEKCGSICWQMIAIGLSYLIICCIYHISWLFSICYNFSDIHCRHCENHQVKDKRFIMILTAFCSRVITQYMLPLQRTHPIIRFHNKDGIKQDMRWFLRQMVFH